MNFNNKLLQLNFYLLLIFPITLVFSKLISEIILFLVIVLVFINFDFFKKKLKEKWVLIFLLFYFWLIITTTQQLNLENFLKSIFYVRFLFFSLGIVLILNTKKKFYLFLASIFFTILFIQIDILIQFFYGKDIFGYLTSNEVRHSGPFGKELIAGGFMAKFFGICFFIFFLYLQIKKIQSYETILSLYLISFLFIVFITGERMAFLLSLLIVFLIFINETKIRKKIFYLFIIFSILTSIFILNNEKYFNRYIKQNLIQTGFNYKDVDYKLSDSIYFRLWTTGYVFFKQKPIIGNGLKFYYNDCEYSEKYFKEIKLTNCTHPHNIYLDIIGATGIIGLTLYILFLYYLYKIAKSKILLREEINYALIFKGSFYSFLILMWPIKTSGAFFNNFNSLILYTVIGIFLTNLKIHQKI